MVEFTFSRFAYFDTNILSHLAKNEALWPKLFEYLKRNGLTLAIGSPQAAELSDANRIHKKLVALFISVPSGIIKGFDTIIAEEVRSHPNKRSDSLLMYPLNALLLEQGGLEKLESFLSSQALRAERNDQLLHAKEMPSKNLEFKANFPPSKSGKYTRKQADEFVQAMVMQWLAIDHRDFLSGFQDHIEDYREDVFQSIRLFAADLGHFFYIPYCELAVMERDLCNVLNQIKRNHDILENTEITNIDFVYNLADECNDATCRRVCPKC